MSIATLTPCRAECGRFTSPSSVMCRVCWLRVPADLRDRVWVAWLNWATSTGSSVPATRDRYEYLRSLAILHAKVAQPLTPEEIAQHEAWAAADDDEETP